MDPICLSSASSPAAGSHHLLTEAKNQIEKEACAKSITAATGIVSCFLISSSTPPRRLSFSFATTTPASAVTAKPFSSYDFHTSRHKTGTFSLSCCLHPPSQLPCQPRYTPMSFFSFFSFFAFFSSTSGSSPMVESLLHAAGGCQKAGQALPSPPTCRD